MDFLSLVPTRIEPTYQDQPSYSDSAWNRKEFSGRQWGPEQAWVQCRMGAEKDIIDKGNGAIPRKAEQGFIVSKPSSTWYRCELNSRPSNGARPRRLPGRPVGLGALFQQESRAS
ncbi:hypothetical protein C8J56DRAFT_1053918 [Mycena floridula]|nr:hypothetical protein C8J56DRAFT_1053918 [Mycena floridula]